VFPDRLAPVRYFREVQHGLSGRVFRVLAHDSHACHIRAGIKFEGKRLSLTFGSVYQTDGERIQLMYFGLSFFEKDSGPGCFARH
jgi:hypothetical protein